jgi:hypothetical protein
MIKLYKKKQKKKKIKYFTGEKTEKGGGEKNQSKPHHQSVTDLRPEILMCCY